MAMSGTNGYFDYLPRFESGNFVSGIGAFIMVAGIVMMFANLLVSLKNGETAPDDPWGGTTLEWQIPSPPPCIIF